MSSRSSISRIARPSVVRDNRTSASSSPCGGIGATDNGTLTDLSYPITSSCSSSATTNGSFDSARLSSSTSFNTQEDEPSSSTKATLTIGTKVIVPSLYVIGTLRYLGETRFKPGIWAGIELDLEGAGKNDGSVQGVRYFRCPEHTGLFVLASKVTPLPDDDGDEEPEPITRTERKKSARKDACRTGRVASSDPDSSKPRTARTCASSGCCANKRGAIPKKQPKAKIQKSNITNSAAEKPQKTKSTATSSATEKLQKSKSTAVSSSATEKQRKTKRPVVSSVAEKPQKSKSTAVSSSVTEKLQKSKSTAISSTTDKQKRSKSTTTSSSVTEKVQKSKSTAISSVTEKVQKSKSTTTSSVTEKLQKSKSTTTSSTTEKKRPKSETLSRLTETTTTSTKQRSTYVPQTTPVSTRSTVARKDKPPLTTSRSTTTRRTKHSIHRPADEDLDNELARMQELLEESRREKEKLCREMDGREAAWERIVSTKESYAIQIKEQQREIERLGQALRASEKERETLTRQTDVSRAQQELIEQQQQRIDKLDRRIVELQTLNSDAQASHEAEMRQHAAQMEQLRNALAERDQTTAHLERECEDLRKASLDALKAYEASVAQLEQEHRQALEAKDAQLAQLERWLAQHERDFLQSIMIEEEQEQPFVNDSQRRLQEQLAIATEELEKERLANKHLGAELEQVRGQVALLHRKTNREYETLQQELEAEIKDKRRVMDDANMTTQALLETQEERDQLKQTVAKLERELADAIRRGTLTERQTAAGSAELKDAYDNLQGMIQDHGNTKEEWIQQIAKLQEYSCSKIKQLENALETERERRKQLEDQIKRDSRRFSSPMTPVSPVSFRFSQQQVYCEICEVYGHDVLSCTAFLHVASDDTQQQQNPLNSYCVNCDVFGSHPTEECPNHDEMF